MEIAETAESEAVETEPETAEPENEDEGIDEGDTESVDPQHWIDQLTAGLEEAEARLGADSRDALRARIELATAYRQIGEPGLAVPLAVRNTLQAEHLFPPNGSLAASLRGFQDEVCALAGYTAGDVRLLTGADVERERVAEVEVEEDEEAEEEVAESGTAIVDEVVSAGGPIQEAVELASVAEAVSLSETVPLSEPVLVSDPVLVSEARLGSEPVLIESAAPAVHTTVPVTAVPVAADQDLYYEVIRLRFELEEAHRTISRLRHRNAKLIEALDDTEFN